MSQLTDLLRASHRGGWPFRNPPNVAFGMNKASPQAKGLVGWWPTLENTGASLLRDHSGYKNDGVVTGAIAASSEKGRVLDYSEDYVTVSDANQYDEVLNLSLAAWFKVDSWSSYSTIFKKDGHFILRLNNAANLWQPLWWNGTEIYTDTNITLSSTGIWHHIAFVIKNNAISALYIDGSATAISPTKYADNARNLTNDLVIGNAPGGGSSEDFDGQIGDTRVYNFALSADKVLRQYQNPWELYAPEIPIFYSIPVVTGAYYQSAAGVLTPVGVILKETSKSFTGSSTLVGSLIKQSQKAFTGATTASGLLIKQTGKIAIGSITASGVLVKSIAKSFTGSLTAAGSLVKQTAKLFTGSLTASGILVTVKAALLSIGGSLTPSGILVRQTGKIMAGSLTATGSVIKETVKAFVGSVTSVGSLATQKIAGGFSQVTGGVLTMTGSLVRMTGKQTAGIATMAGTITKRITKTFTGVLTAVGTLARQLLGLPVPETRIYVIESENRVYAIPG